MTIVYVVLVLYLRNGWGRLESYNVDRIEPSTRVSVIIAARNEQMNIGRTLNAILAQNYPKPLLEIIVVDDHSTDQTGSIVQSYAEQGVRLITLNEGNKLNSYKKFAIDRAIRASTGEVIVTTDADCRMGPEWVRTIIRFMEQSGMWMVSSPVCYDQEKTHFERLQTLEFLYLIGIGAAGIGNGNPTTCNGANFAYKKSLFFEMDGFKGIDDLASGDDELLLHKVAEQHTSKIGFCKSRNAIVYTDAKTSLQSFISQRKRWASKSTKYKDKKVVVLGVCVWLFNLALLLGVLSLLWGGIASALLVLISLLLKVTVELIFLLPIVSFVGRRELLGNLPMLSIIHAVYLVYIGVSGNVGKYDWKGRQVR